MLFFKTSVDFVLSQRQDELVFADFDNCGKFSFSLFHCVRNKEKKFIHKNSQQFFLPSRDFSGDSGEQNWSLPVAVTTNYRAKE
jgi:hypothetical protein